MPNNEDSTEAADRAPPCDDASGNGELPLSPFQAAMAEECKKLAGRPRHCALNAIQGIQRAWLIAGVDPEIALFRAITAEEEAATALIFSLRQRKYPGSKALNFQRHDDKIGLSILVQAIGSVFAQSGWPQPKLQIIRDLRRPRIELHLPAEFFGFPKEHLITPDNPLNLSIRQGQGAGPSDVMLFEEQLADISKATGANSIAARIAAEANLRNKILYASDSGIAVVENPESFILERKRRAFVLIGLTIIILQTRNLQPLAVQAIESYLIALGRSHNEVFDYTPVTPEPDVLVEVERVDGQPPRTTIRKRR